MDHVTCFINPQSEFLTLISFRIGRQMKEYTASDLFIFNDHEKVIIISSTSCSICTCNG